MAGLYCSFCRKDKENVGMLVAGPGVYICESCIAVCARILTGKPTTPFGRWDSLSDEECLAMLPATAGALDSAERALREHVDVLRKRAISWERIANALGVSRQSAWERFSNEH
jgi:ATP-dependent protease Clp ATPase subunit